MRRATEGRDGIAKWRWQFATQRLRDAYEASRSALDAILLEIDRDHAKWKGAKPDTDSPHGVDAHEAWLDYIVDRHDETRLALETIKRGFAIILYHSWEQHAVKWTDWQGKYHHGHVTGRLRRMGYYVAAEIHQLNKIANCVKHNSAELWKANPDLFDDTVKYSIKNGLRADFGDNLLLSDGLLNEMFDALLASGPPGKATPVL